MDTKNLPGSLKVAILIQSMGEKESQEILNCLSSSERDLVKQHLSQMGMISPDVVEKVAKEFPEYKNKVSVATFIGKLVAERANEKGIKKVVFDRSGFLYHGRVKALSDGAREAGLDF